jgi:hypothetical protein
MAKSATVASTAVKTGETYWRDEEGLLWLAESWQDMETGEVWTTQTLQEEE